MNYLIVGAGYTGKRVAIRLPAERTWITRRVCGAQDGDRCVPLDLDAIPSSVATPNSPWSLLYTVPPEADSDGDPRLQSLLDALVNAPERIVYLSTSGVYGQRHGSETDEGVPVAPRTARAKRRAAAEAVLSAWCAERSVPLFVLRVPGIYGPGRLGLERLRQGAAVLQESEAPPGNRIHVDDLAAACVAALEVQADAGAYNIGDGDHRSSTAFSNAVARHAGLEAPPQISLAEAQKVWSPARLSFLTESRRLDTRRMRTVLGVSPRYADPEDGIRASLLEEGTNPT